MTSVEETNKIETYIAEQRMASLGTRRGDPFGSRIKIIGWSANLKKEAGVGYKVMVINSNDEQFGDQESRDKISDFFDTKDFAYAKQYIEKMESLNQSLTERLQNNIAIDGLTEFSLMMTYFIVIRWVIENVFENATVEEQKYIEDWRNSQTIFSSLMMFYDKFPQDEPNGPWSVVVIDGVMTQVDKVISCKVHPDADSQTEIKGSVGYKGIISGKARVVFSNEDRDAIEEGEIIVAPMTTLDFLPAMKKAIAFVTDEGGVTCHAAIVAREMKKPCIIGTRIGTKTIKTGDMIEVDAEKGIVTIIK